MSTAGAPEPPLGGHDPLAWAGPPRAKRVRRPLPLPLLLAIGVPLDAALGYAGMGVFGWTVLLLREVAAHLGWASWTFAFDDGLGFGAVVLLILWVVFLAVTVPLNVALLGRSPHRFRFELTVGALVLLGLPSVVMVAGYGVDL